MNKTEALDAVRFLRNSLFNTRGINAILENLEEYILTHDAEVIKETLNSVYGIQTKEVVRVPLEITCNTHLEEVER